MASIIGFLLIAWLVLVIIGVVFHALLWLALIGVILFVATTFFGVGRLRKR